FLAQESAGQAAALATVAADTAATVTLVPVILAEAAALGNAAGSLIAALVMDDVSIWDWGAGAKLPTCDPSAPAFINFISVCDSVPVIGFGHGSAQTVQVTRATDPNFLSGPSGFGSQEFLAGQGSYPYYIAFSNEADAGAPAQQVVVSQQLDPNLDL